MRTWLKELRLKKGYTQQDVAEKCNISRSYYTHIESGTKTPTVKIAKLIASVLNFSWTIFFENKCSLKEQNTA
ncbi:helix-turn-helix transcriptional regulator [Bacillus sp. JJ722]|uniref:helix-turn-helix transcriptional regulator n=1 Tax=Bacillus sp. JJ722 TaxID=3122973 RepID=UPI002FFFCECC